MQAFALEAFQGLSGRVALTGLLHSLWIGLGAVATVALVFQYRRHLSHRSRYTLLLMTFVFVATAPSVIAPMHYALASRDSNRVHQRELFSARFGAAELEVARPAVTHGAAATVAAKSRRPSSSFLRSALALSRSIVDLDRFQPFLLGMWLVGSATLGSFLVFAVCSVHGICREASPAPESVRERVGRLARRARMKKAPAVMVHPRLGEPCFCGLFRPVILLPEFWLTCGRGSQLEAILAHEVAHARRLDHLLNLAQRLVEVGLFFNPAVHWLSRSLRRQREFCADALAVRLTGEPLALAEALEAVARHRLTSPFRRPLGAALGGQTVSLLPRIQELIGMTPSRTRPRFWPFVTLSAAGLIALFTATVGLAQNQPSEGREPGQAQRSPAGHQVVYNFRSFDLTTEALREINKARPKRADQDVSDSAWIADPRELDGLLAHLGKLNARRISEVSEITALENATVKVKVSDGNWRNRINVGNSGSGTAELNGRKRFIGSAAEFSGQSREGRMRLTIDLRIVPIDELAHQERKNAPADTTFAAGNGPSPVREGATGVSFDLPQGSSVAILLPLAERESHSAKRTGSDASAHEGASQAKQIELTRLFLITPRPVDLDADKTSIPGIKGFFHDTPRTR